MKTKNSHPTSGPHEGKKLQLMLLGAKEECFILCRFIYS